MAKSKTILKHKCKNTYWHGRFTKRQRLYTHKWYINHKWICKECIEEYTYAESLLW